MTKNEIQEFIDDVINPALQMHDGYVLVESFDKDTNILAYYNKNKLVPFGEFLPLENLLSRFGFKKINSL